MKYKMFTVLLGPLLASTGIAHAQNINIEEVPTSWRMENYPNNDIVAWIYSLAAAPCNSKIEFAQNATTDDRNRFWSLVLSAKLSGRAVGLYVSPENGACRIWSFYIQ